LNDFPVAIRIVVADDAVFLDDREIGLRSRERLLLTALALGETDAEVLTSQLWPTAERRAGRNTLKVHVHQLRRQLGADVVATTRAGYALTVPVAIDLCAEEAELQPDAAMTLERRRRFMHVLDALIAPGNRGYPLQPRFASLQRRLARVLADDFLREQQTTEAFALSRRLIACDGCDPFGYEIAIRAALQTGDALLAHRTLGQYTERLKAELGLAPPRELTALLAV
jgi:DNA-binding SARP family transcriptional activator